MTKKMGLLQPGSMKADEEVARTLMSPSEGSRVPQRRALKRISRMVCIDSEAAAAH